MSAQSPKAFLMSATLHVAALALLLFFTFWANRQQEIPPVFELVAGEGDNFAAKEAPARTADIGIKVDLPTLPDPPTPEPAEPEPVTVTPAPPQPTPTPPPPQPTPAPPQPKAVPAPPQPKATTPPPKKAPDMAKQLRREVIIAESRAKQKAARERAAEAKRLAEEKKRQEKSKAEADAKAKKSSPAKIAKIDTDGLVKSVLGGAGGKALTTDNEDVLGAYFAMFKQRVRAEFEAPTGLSDAVGGEFEFRIHADGSISNVRAVKSSGSAEFDRAVIEAVRRVRMPAHPAGRSETVVFQFTMRDRETR